MGHINSNHCSRYVCTGFLRVCAVLLRQRGCALCLQGGAASVQQTARGTRHAGSDPDPRTGLKVGPGPVGSGDVRLTAGPGLHATETGYMMAETDS